MAVLVAMPGFVLGIMYAGAMFILTLILNCTDRFKDSITPTLYLRGGLLVTLALCLLDLILEPGQESGPWLIFFFLGFQIVVILTSFFPPDKQPAPDLPPEKHRD